MWIPLQARTSTLPKRSGTQKKLAIVYPAPYFDLSPSLQSFIAFFSQRGYAVDLYTVFMPAQSAHDLARFKVKVHKLSLLQMAQKRKRQEPGSKGAEKRQKNISLKHALKKIFYALASLELMARARLGKPETLRALIGVDLPGLTMAANVASFLKIPYIYCSLELFPDCDLQTEEEKSLKKLEVRQSQKAFLTITQDKDRKAQLVRDNRLTENKILCIPNAYLPSLFPPPPSRPKKELRRRFGIPEEARVALYTGSLARWAALPELVRCARSFPEPWVLLLHSYGDRLHKRKEQHLQKLALPDKVFFSWKAFDLKAFAHFLACADAGIAFYDPQPGAFTNENVRLVGLSSGKVGCYLAAGLPVIVNEGTTLSAFVQATGCGVCVDSFEEVRKALSKLDDNYSFYREHALKAYRAHWDPEPGLTLLHQKIEGYWRR